MVTCNSYLPGEITCIAWNESMQIASGSKDTRIIVWDGLSETGVMKLAGHKGMVTQIRFWKDFNYLVSCSTDATIRIWDLVTQYNVHIIPCNVQVKIPLFEVINLEC